MKIVYVDLSLLIVEGDFNNDLHGLNRKWKLEVYLSIGVW